MKNSLTNITYFVLVYALYVFFVDNANAFNKEYNNKYI